MSFFRGSTSFGATSSNQTHNQTVVLLGVSVCRPARRAVEDDVEEKETLQFSVVVVKCNALFEETVGGGQ